MSIRKLLILIVFLCVSTIRGHHARQSNEDNTGQKLGGYSQEQDNFEFQTNSIARVNGEGTEQVPYTLVNDYLTLGRLRTMVQRGKDLITQLPTLGLVVSGKPLTQVPTLVEIFQYPKKTLFSIPQEVTAYVVDNVCSAAISLSVVQPRYEPDVSVMNLLLITQKNEEVIVPLTDAERLWNDSKFKKDLKVVIVVTGWNSNVNETNDALETLYKAYRCRDDYNFIVIDTDTTVDSLYSWSAYNIKTIGKIIGKAMVNLTNIVGENNIHLIGHSLGAHICSEAGKTYTELTNKWLTRITGLDPARTCFNEDEYLNGLRSGDASFVDVIHSNPGILGIKEPVGDVDFYPNGYDTLQPGCLGTVCCHSRSYQYYAESVYPGKENNFMATKCTSFNAYKLGQCSTEKLPMGYATPMQSRGTYYLETRANPPFGLDQPRRDVWPYRVPVKQQCKHYVA